MNKKLVGLIGKSLLGLIAVFVVMFVAGVATGYLAAHGSMNVDQATLIVTAIMAVLLMSGSVWLGARWMASIDEAAREAHKAAWYWGGTAGMSLGGVGVILAALPQAAEIDFTAWQGRTDPAAYAAAGAVAMIGLMTLGYAVVWVWWWLARR